MSEDKYLYYYNKVIETKSNLIDIVNFIDNKTNEITNKLNTENNKDINLHLFEMEKSSEVLKDKIELSMQELILTLKVVATYENELKKK